jgi:transcriptional regulator with XRE-family HTH domain
LVRYSERIHIKLYDSKPATERRVPVSLAVGKKIATLRQIRGLSLPGLAEKAEISKGYLWQIENGSEPNPSLGVLTKIATALDTTVADLLGRPTVRAKRALPEELPSGLKDFLEEKKRKGAPVPEDIIRALANLKARGRKTISREDWTFLYEAIKRAMGREDRA